MEWVLIPLTLFGATAVCVAMCCLSERGGIFGPLVLFVAPAVLLGLSGFVAVFAVPWSYYDEWAEANGWEGYYTYVVAPHIVEEYDDYVVVDSSETMMWQAGGRNVGTYNAYLRENREWNDVPWFKWGCYDAPASLKYVRIQDAVG